MMKTLFCAVLGSMGFFYLVVRLYQHAKDVRIRRTLDEFNRRSRI